MFEKKTPKKCDHFSFPILGGPNLTRALKSSAFQISGGSHERYKGQRTKDKGQRTEILVSNFEFKDQCSRDLKVSMLRVVKSYIFSTLNSFFML